MAYKNNKKYYPSKKKDNVMVPYKDNNYSPFSRNLSKDLKFGNKGDDISAYVERELIIVDSQGNRKIARERQFFNSGKRIGKVEIE